MKGKGKLGDTKSSTNFFSKGSNPNSGRNKHQDIKSTIVKDGYSPPKPPTSL